MYSWRDFGRECFVVAVEPQPRSQGFSLLVGGGREKPWERGWVEPLTKAAKKVISSHSLAASPLGLVTQFPLSPLPDSRSVSYDRFC